MKLGPDDTVVLSARAIPGNEKAIARVMSHIARRGADVVTDTMKHVHVSGHGSAEELKLVLSLVRPRYFVPIHGEYRQLSQHARVAKRVMSGADHKLQVLLAENGDIIQFDSERRAHRRQGADRTRADRRDARRRGRRRSACAIGATSPATASSWRWSRSAGRPARSSASPSSSRAASSSAKAKRESLFKDAAGVIAECIEASGVEERADQGLMTEKLRVELRRFFKKRSGRRPLVLPVLMEI